jgi:lysophospholipase L1-like esterase
MENKIMKDYRVMFIGDSFVNGVGDELYMGWVDRLSEYTAVKFKNLDITSYNLGIRKETSSDIAKRWEAEALQRDYGSAKNIIVFSFGVNDVTMVNGTQRVSYQNSKKNLQQILINAKDKFDDVLFVMPPPIADSEVNTRIHKLITIYKEVCKELGIKYIDVHNELLNDEIWMQEVADNDGAHPKTKGYEIFAIYIFEDDNWIDLWK